MIIEIKSVEEFEIQIVKNKKCVVKFWAQWCVPCRKLDDVIENLARTYSDIVFLKVNVELLPSISSKYFISNLPTMLFMKDGSIVKQMIGNTDKNKISCVLKDLA